MKNLNLPFDNIPPVLIEFVQNKLQQFSNHSTQSHQWLTTKLQSTEFASELINAWSASPFVADLCLRFPDVFQVLVDQDDLWKSVDDQSLKQRIEKVIVTNKEGEQLNASLRQCRSKEMLRIIWRDVNNLASLQETTRNISILADSCIQLAVNYHHKQLCTEYGVPVAVIDGQPVEQEMLVLGMGKLGAYELNLSSDIDLIFCYPHSGETMGDSEIKKTLDNHEFFTRLGRRVIQSLDQITSDGFVFRVDMRLRPYGESGSLVLSFGALEEYYQSQGREWERYAMVKARVITGTEANANILISMLRPFTYRRYIDFSAIESLRAMKKMIRQEVKRRRLQEDVKLGAGGIREIEFIVQSFQLVRGGREKDLQDPSVFSILPLLSAKQYLPDLVVQQLQEAYYFLRNTEHAIQAFNDKQTQTIPKDEYARSALVRAMSFTCWDDFSKMLDMHRNHVSYHFQQIISNDENEDVDTIEDCWQLLWSSDRNDEHSLIALQQAGHEQVNVVLDRLIHLRDSQSVKRMQNISRERLDLFMPLLLQAVTHSQHPSETLLRILPLVESVLRRTAYLVLLVENSGALQQLVVLCSASPWIATKLARHPVLLDELLDARTLYTVPEKQVLHDDLQQQMLRVNWDDLEAHMEVLRYFKQAHQLRVTAAEVVGHLPLMKVSDYLTVIAEVILEYVLELAWHHLVEKHGRPQLSEGSISDKGFIIVGYGKLGGIELGHGSDLDLVFIHSSGNNLMTDGERSVDNSVFFSRLGQRIIHILTAQTAMGQLYDVDMRLRPSGESGLLVSSLSAFEAYQHKTAWTWEHQALVRARVVAGDRQMAESFSLIRSQLLCLDRDCKKLKTDVREMRQKMRDHLMPKGLETPENPFFHLKHGTGAIVDIEFMVQYTVLAWSHQHPGLAAFTDNIRILEALEKEALFNKQEANALIEAYKAFRAAGHRQSLQEQAGLEKMSEFTEHRSAVTKKWKQLMDS